jgi:hypothetical protein
MQVAPSAAIAVFIAAAGTVVIGLYPTFVYNFAADAATHVFTALTGGFP